MTARKNPDAGHAHAHLACTPDEITELLVEAAEICRARRGKLTPLRRRVLTLLLESPRPVKAYDLLEKLEDGREAKPPTIYRTLDFLVEMGLVHKLESLQSFLACGHWKHAHAAVFLICTNCGSVAELDAKGALAKLSQETQGVAFKPRSTIIEVRGICAECGH